MKKFKSFLLLPIYVLLLPVFFILHVFAEYHALSPVTDALELTLVYETAGILIFGVCWLLLKNIRQAGFISFSIVAVNFFFGTVHDVLRSNLPGTWITRYVILLPLILIWIFILIFYLLKTRPVLIKTTRYLNVLFAFLIVIDAAIILQRNMVKQDDAIQQLSTLKSHCDTCTKPDIFLIMVDEYAGKKELTDLFSYDNSPFEQALTKRGFHTVNDSRANYNYTINSIASLLNMDYYFTMQSDTVNEIDVTRSRAQIKNNHVVDFLHKNGYDIHNFSFLDIGKSSPAVTNFYFPTRKLFTARTLLGRFQHDLWFHFASDKEMYNVMRNDLFNNRKIDSLTKNIARQDHTKPRFVYTHLLMPHHPYFFDSSGRENGDALLSDAYNSDRKAYLGYLHYTNRKLLELIDYIQQNKKSPPVIMLMSDHGFHQFTETVEDKYHFMNINALFLPKRNYDGFYDGMSNVNQFRVLFNTLFSQKNPLLKDSTIFLWESKQSELYD